MSRDEGTQCVERRGDAAAPTSGVRRRATSVFTTNGSTRDTVCVTAQSKRRSQRQQRVESHIKQGGAGGNWGEAGGSWGERRGAGGAGGSGWERDRQGRGHWQALQEQVPTSVFPKLVCFQSECTRRHR